MKTRTVRIDDDILRRLAAIAGRLHADHPEIPATPNNAVRVLLGMPPLGHWQAGSPELPRPPAPVVCGVCGRHSGHADDCEVQFTEEGAK